MARTTIQDYGRRSEQFGMIPYFYAFPYKFWFQEHQIAPDDVATWCFENCIGYYKIVCYTHENSVRDPKDPRKWLHQVVYVDKVYLSDDHDAVTMRLTFSILDVKVRRPRAKPFNADMLQESHETQAH